MGSKIYSTEKSGQPYQYGVVTSIDSPARQSGRSGRRSPHRSGDTLMVRLLRWIYPDQRKATRHAFPPLVSYFGAVRSALEYEVGDVSATGFYMLTRENWLPGTEMPVTLKRTDFDAEDGTDTITVLSTVVRVGADGIGFSFKLAETAGQHEASHPGAWATEPQLAQFLKGLKLSEPEDAELERAS